MRAFVWASGNTITETDVASALFSSRKSGQSDLLNRAIGGGFQINSVIKEVITHYLERAMTEAKDNKTQARKAPRNQALSNTQQLVREIQGEITHGTQLVYLSLWQLYLEASP